ncbi:TolC family protein [Cupriavidus basilensis]
MHSPLPLLGCLLLAACAVGPDFRTPAPTSDAGYVAGPQPQANRCRRHARRTPARPVTGVRESVPMCPRSGGHCFAAPRSMRPSAPRSTAARPSRRPRRNCARRKRNLAARTGATRWPTVDANLNTTRQQVNFQSLGITAIPSPGPFTLYGATVQVSYVLDLFGGQRRELENLQAAVDYQRYEFEAARLALAANVATAAIREAGCARNWPRPWRLPVRSSARWALPRTGCAPAVSRASTCSASVPNWRRHRR